MQLHPRVELQAPGGFWNGGGREESMQEFHPERISTSTNFAHQIRGVKTESES
jgi:hypothetical protein